MTARAPGAARVRYIGFRLRSDEPVSRQGLIAAIRRTGRRIDAEGFEAAEPWLTRYDGELGIVRCHHTHVDVTRAILDALDVAPADDHETSVSVQTLATSGTIRSLTDKTLKGLRDTGRRR